jgi:hypothetical protein
MTSLIPAMTSLVPTLTRQMIARMSPARDLMTATAMIHFATFDRAATTEVTTTEIRSSYSPSHVLTFLPFHLLTFTSPDVSI